MTSKPNLRPNPTNISVDWEMLDELCVDLPELARKTAAKLEPPAQINLDVARLALSKLPTATLYQMIDAGYQEMSRYLITSVQILEDIEKELEKRRYLDPTDAIHKGKDTIQ